LTTGVLSEAIHCRIKLEPIKPAPPVIKIVFSMLAELLDPLRSSQLSVSTTRVNAGHDIVIKKGSEADSNPELLEN
jgi:hypothetical protein